MTVTKLLLRKINPNEGVRREQVFKTLMTKLEVPLLGLRSVANGYNAIVERKEDAEKMLEDEGVEALRTLNLCARVPPEIKAKRTLLVRKVDQWVGSHSKEDIKEELERNHAWLKIREVTKIKQYTHLFKIEFVSVAMTDRALQEGLLCFFTRLAPSQMERETYISLQMCFKCYKYENHNTDKCPEGDIKWCSECGNKDHTYTDCPDKTIKRCLNCNGPHRTMAMACPIKKELMTSKAQEKEDQDNENRNRTYANIAQKAAEKAVQETKKAEPSKTPVLKIKDSTELKTAVVVIHAHIHNMIVPGTYKEELNRNLIAHDLPTIEVPENPPSARLFNLELPDVFTAAEASQVIEIQERFREQQAFALKMRKELEESEKDQEQEEMEATESEATAMPPPGTKTVIKTDQGQYKKQKATVAQPPYEERIREQRQKSRERSRVRKSTDEQQKRSTEETHRVVTPREVDVILATDEEEIRQRETIEPVEIKQLINAGKIKFVQKYECKFRYDEINKLINRKQLTEKGSNIKLIEKGPFRKLRSGRERTPPLVQQASALADQQLEPSL